MQRDPVRNPPASAEGSVNDEILQSWNGIWKTRNGYYVNIVDSYGGLLRGSWYSPDGARFGFAAWNSNGNTERFEVTSSAQSSIPMLRYDLDLSRRKLDHDRWDLPEVMKPRRS